MPSLAPTLPNPKLQFSSAEAKLFDTTGVSLASLYDSLIVRDASVAEQAGKLCFFHEGYEFNCGHILERKLTERSPLWPVVLSQCDLFAEWCDPCRLYPSRDFFLEIGSFNWMSMEFPEPYQLARLLEETVRQRLNFMTRALREGAIEAFGHTAGYGPAERISTGVWDSRSTRISFSDNEVHVVSTTSRLPPSDAIRRRVRPVEETQCLWHGVVVRGSPSMQRKPDRPPIVDELVPKKNKGGAEQKYPWKEAIELLALSYAMNGEAQSGADLYRRFAQIFEFLGMPHDNINEDSIRLALDKQAPKIKASALGTLQMKPLPKPEAKHKPQKVR